MAWTSDNIMELFKFLTRKNQSGSISSTDFFYAWNTEQSSYHQDIVGRWQARANGKQGMNTGLIQDQTIMTELAPFTIPKELPITSGKVVKPNDFIYTAALRINGVKVWKLNPDQLDQANASVIDPPSTSANKYYYTEYQDYFYLLPQSVTGNLSLDYIAEPTPIKWGYTFDNQGRQVYDPATSVQPKWDTNVIITITKRALTNLGVSYKDADFSNYGRNAQLTGN